MTAPPIMTFKDLLVWQKAMDLSVEVYHLTKNYPSHERYGLTAETRKTSRSVKEECLNRRREAELPDV